MIKKEPISLYPRFDIEHYDEIVDYYNQKIELDKTNYYYWGARGSAYYELGYIDEAISDFTQAIELEPDYAMGYYKRGRCYFDFEEFDKAIIEFEKSKSVDKTLLVNDFYLGLCYSDSKEYDKAIACYTSFETLDDVGKHTFGTVLDLRANMYYLTNQNEKASRDIAELLLEDADYLADIEKLNEPKKYNNNKPNVEGEIDFANIFDETSQHRWINDLSYNKLTGPKFDNEVVRESYKDSFLLFKEKPYYQELIKILAAYMECAIPNYLASEYNYWTISCKPNKQNEAAHIVTIDINYAAVLLIYVDKDNSLLIDLKVSKLPYLNYLLQHGVDSFVNKTLAYEFEHYTFMKDYDKGDDMQINLNQEQFKEAINDPLVLSSIRLYTLRMMNNVGNDKKNTRKPSHCLDLADAIINLQ